MFEIEQKYRVQDREAVESTLASLDFKPGAIEQHCDTYYNHPCRDFGETKEALRIRRIEGVPFITYKGTKLPGNVKARRELEWGLGEGDPNGKNMEQLLVLLGFRRVAEVIKKRQTYNSPDAFSTFDVVIDQVNDLGTYAEIERIASSESEVNQCREQIQQLGTLMNLADTESRSYLRMLVEKG